MFQNVPVSRRERKIPRSEEENRRRLIGSPAARYRLLKSGDGGSADFPADDADREVHREKILVPVLLGSEDEIANLDAGRPGNGKMARGPLGDAKAVAGGEVHVPLPGEIAELFALKKAAQS
jgi:hypothetical protein